MGKFCLGFVTGGEMMFLLILLKSKLRLKAGDTVLSCSGGWGRISLAGWGWGWGLETSLYNSLYDSLVTAYLETSL